eukprot:252602-Chlamydomonas_euryale.AAC.1
MLPICAAGPVCRAQPCRQGAALGSECSTVQAMPEPTSQSHRAAAPTPHTFVVCPPSNQPPPADSAQGS